MANKPVFYDESGRRARRVSILGWSGAVLSTLLGIVVLVSIAVSQKVASPDFPFRLSPNASLERKLELQAAAPSLIQPAEKLATRARLRRARARHHQAEMHRQSRPLAQALSPKKGQPLTVAFYVNWDDLSYDSLRRSLKKIDWFAPSWMFVSGKDMGFTTTPDSKALRLLRRRRPNMPILPVLQNATLGQWYGPDLQTLLADPARRQILERKIVAFIALHHFQGMVVDFENVPEGAYKDLETFLAETSAAFLPHGWILVQAAPFDDDGWPYTDFARHLDYTLLMAYDEHGADSEPGPVAGQPWFENTLDLRARQLSPARTIIGIGSYAYDWHGKDADILSFNNAAIRAHDAHARILFDPNSNNPHFTYLENDSIRHDVWFLDGVTAFNQIHAADWFQPAGYALWRLGSEDPTVWKVFNRPYGAPAPEALKHIPEADDIDYEGYGEILRVEDDPSPGARTIEIDARTGDIDDEDYTDLPTNYVIRRVGQSANEIALTFDDGPDAEYTPAILDILKRKKVPATFFVIGANIEAHPELVQRMIAEGHEVGNHTFTHPNLAETSIEADRLELNATQRIFEAMTGHSMRLFRPPYLADAEPDSRDEIIPVKLAQSLGYVIVGVHVDPLDWQKPTVDHMLKRIEEAVHNPNPEIRGNVIMMHDSGGDRSRTVEMLPELIDRLRADGYHFVPVSDLAGLTRAEAMPKIAPTPWLTLDRFVFIAVSFVGHVLYYCFLIAIFLGIGRLFLLSVLSLVNLRRARLDEASPPTAATHTTSVLIPAYNEEKVIVATIRRILGSEGCPIDVIVIDDGSTDNTAGLVRETFGSDPRVRLIVTPNGGKAHALNVGLAEARGEVVVALDADTVFQPDTVARLVRWFDDPTVGAVAGNAKVGNRINMITRWQALEYVVAQNLERRALAALDAFTVVPGAVGAWRRETLTELGGFPANTLAEDQDLTIALQGAGYQVRFDASAIAWTEAPTTVRGLARQRFRWSFGTLQCLWKYRGMMLRPRYGALGMVAMPQVWLFQILLTVLAPFADLMLIFQLVTQWVAYMQHGSEYTNNSLYLVLAYYVIFTVVDLLAAMFGFLMEKREQWSLLWWLILQRFGYRQIMYYVVVRSLATALRGAFVGWNKLERTGTVTSR